MVGCSKEEQVQGRGQGRVGLAVGGGARACGGVGGRGTGPRNGAKRIFFLLVEKWLFLKDALWDGGGYPPELAREGLAWRGKAGWVPTGGRGVREAGQGLGRGARASVLGG